jgi:predicted RNA-binding protein YlqC (UPF0109 family)
MSSIDQQFVEYIVKSIVGNPDSVSIERSIDEKGVLLELTVNPEDLGRVIGKRGATAQSLRTLLRALGTKNEARYNLKIVDNSPEGARQPRSASGDFKDVGGSSTADDSAEYEAPEPKASKEAEESTVVSDARKELEDLDDLDI